MPTDVTITLNSLHCLRESEGGSEPYIWPVLLWIDDITVQTPDLVGVSTSLILGNARTVLKSGMKAGETATIPFPLGSLGVSFEEGLTMRQVLLVVALLENDETPEAAMWAGCKAFSSELRAEIAVNLPALSKAINEGDDAGLKQIIKDIKASVGTRVSSATWDALTGWQKTRVVIGTLNLDDLIGVDYYFSEPVSANFLLSFSSDDQARADLNYVGSTLWTPWSSVSEGSTTPGAIISARPWGQRFALFVADPNGGIYTTGGDPPGGFGPWASVSEGSTTPGALISATPWGQVFALFVTGSDGAVYTTGGDPQGGFGPWAGVSDSFISTPGAPVTAVRWGSRFALFATNSNGAACTAGGEPQGGLLGPWAVVSDGFVTVPGAPVTAVPWGSRFALFATNSNGAVCTAGGDPQGGLLGPWASVSDGFVTVPGAAVTAVPWGSRFALFGTDSSGGIFTAAGDPQSGLLGPWASVSQGRSMPGSFIAAIPFGQGFALFVTDPNGGIYTTGGDPQAGFGPWAYVPGISASPGSPVTAVRYGQGFALFVANSSGGIFTTSSRLPEFTLDGMLDARERKLDLCQAQVDRVKAVQAVIDSIDAQINVLKVQLKHATPQQKPSIIAQISRLSQELTFAMAALEEARRALQDCRNHWLELSKIRGSATGVERLG